MRELRARVRGSGFRGWFSRFGAWPVAALPWLAVACGGDGGPVDPVPPPPPPPSTVTLDLAIGEAATVTDPGQLSAIELLGGPGAREYQLIVQSASTSPAASTTMRVGVTALSAATSVVDAGARRAPPSFGTAPGHFERRQGGLLLEDELRRNTRRELERVNARPAPANRILDSGARYNVRATPPSFGDMVTYNLAVTQSLQVDCNSDATIDAQIKWVGDNFAIAEDVQLAGRFTQQDFDELGELLDSTIFPVETAYFGSPADIDGNDVVVALITAEVNRMTPRGAGFLIAGFFFDGDLFDSADCAASNEGELFYLIGPDPNGQYSDPVGIDEAISLARTTVGHEFLHLLNTQQRFTIGGGGAAADEVAWLDEGLAHFAEELVGLSVVGASLRGNLDLFDVAPVGDAEAGEAFNDFHLLNLQRAARYLLDPNGTPALGTSGGGDPPGTESLKMRGFGYLFARWLGDQYGPAGNGPLPGAAEAALFRELSTGGPSFLTGTDNVERAVQVVAGQTRSWEELLADFLAMVAVDDLGVSGIDPELTSLTWNYRDLFGQLSEEEFTDSNGNPVPPPSELQNPYPLIPDFISINATTNVSRTLPINASTGGYFLLTSSADMPDLVVEVTTSSGSVLPISAVPQATVIRIR
ncbi:MAG: hypothetical protein R3195_03335 [Gemmatimonadota bacterium]|nr:hypothetical protein [Gemmatimonadota bacterium]